MEKNNQLMPKVGVDNLGGNMDPSFQYYISKSRVNSSSGRILHRTNIVEMDTLAPRDNILCCLLVIRCLIRARCVVDIHGIGI